MSDPATLAWYQREAARYAAAFGSAPSRHLDGFLDRLAPRARVLELGCGGGRDSVRIARRGFALDATDGTPALAAIASERLGAPVRVVRFEALRAEAAYDAVWAHACLLHVPRAEMPSVLAAIHRALTPDGWHFADYKLGDGEGRDPLGRLTNFPDTAWLDAAYRAAGFEIADSEVYRGEGADGVVRDWYALTVRRS